jgi:hypothetical protein
MALVPECGRYASLREGSSMRERIVAGIREHAWHREIPPEVLPQSVATMLAFGERQMLYWLARELPIPGVIVDAGCFIGGSTQALAAGFAANASTTGKLGRIHTYDMFLAPRDGYSLNLIGNGKKPGDTIFDVFNANVGMLLPLVAPHVGDFLSFGPPAEPINLLFVDIAKSTVCEEGQISRPGEFRAGRAAARPANGAQYGIAYVSHISTPALTPFSETGEAVLNVLGEGLMHGFRQAERAPFTNQIWRQGCTGEVLSWVAHVE